VLELTLMRLAWTFNFDIFNYNLAGVLWMLGWSMVAMAALVWLPLSVVAAVGLAIIFGHNLIDGQVRRLQESLGESPLRWLWQILYFGGSLRIGGEGPRLAILYSLLPWIGVMAAGFAFGTVLTLPAERRTRACIAIGAAGVTVFVVLRTFNLYGNPQPWSPPQRPGAMPALFSFLNTAKYPASLLFLLMTLAPQIALLPAVERAKNAAIGALEVFGRVPLFYYVLHIPLIHVAAMVVSIVRTGTVTPWLFGNFPLEPDEQPDGYRWSLMLLYVVTAIVVTILYFACRWYDARRSAARHAGSLMRERETDP